MLDATGLPDPVHVQIATPAPPTATRRRADGLHADAPAPSRTAATRRSTRPGCSTERRSSSRSTATPSRQPPSASRRPSAPPYDEPSYPAGSRARRSTTSASPARSATGSSTTRPRPTRSTSPATTTSGCSSTASWLSIWAASTRPCSGSVTFGAGARQTKFGLTDGQVYEVAVFQAERQTDRVVVPPDAERIQRRAQRVPPDLRRRHRRHRRGVRRRQERGRLRRVRARTASWASTAATASCSPTTRTATTA